VLLFFSVAVSAQQIKHIGIAEGLDGLQAFRVTQDKKGFVWISNRFGVDRYDGYKIKHYTIPILTNNNPVFTIDVLRDNDTDVWAYTNRGGIYCYNEYSDGFEMYKDLNLFLRTLSFDENNHIWFGSSGLFGHIENDVVSKITNPLLDEKLVKKIIHYQPYEKIIVTDRSILLYDEQTDKLHHFFEKKEQDIIASMQVETAYYDRERSQLWIGTLNQGVLVYLAENKSFKLIQSLKESNTPVMSIVPVNDTAVFVGTDGMGAWLIDRNKYALIKTYRQGNAEGNSLSGDGIYDIFQDRENRIWMSTYSGGVNVVDFDYRSFKIEKHQPENPHSLSSDLVTCMLEDTDRHLWFGTDDGISVKNPDTNRWSHFLKSHYILDIYEDSHQHLGI
jgi:ligand-binding sensor domain-containing protein